MQSLVTVNIPAYNHENYIQETIQSIINQTYQNIELIVIDDGSKDSTWQKICEMKDACEKRFVNVVFETQENHGTCYTNNRHLKKAQGEYIYFIASDDKAAPDAIEKLQAFLSQNPDYALCVGDDAIIDSNSKICYWDKKRNIVYDKNKAKYITFADFLQKTQNLDFTQEYFGTYNTIYPRNYIPNGYLIRKSIFEKIGLFTKEAPLEDYWLMLQISKYAKMKYIDEILFYYRWHNTNTIKQKSKIGDYTKRTRIYENKLLNKSDLSTMRPEVKEFCEKGCEYKKRNYLGILTKSVTMSPYKKKYQYKLLGFPIITRYKDMP